MCAARLFGRREGGASWRKISRPYPPRVAEENLKGTLTTVLDEYGLSSLRKKNSMLDKEASRNLEELEIDTLDKSEVGKALNVMAYSKSSLFGACAAPTAERMPHTATPRKVRKDAQACIL
jgi:hypothetical protein